MRAVVDIGSNSIKVLVAQIERGALIEKGSISRITRLGKGLAAATQANTQTGQRPRLDPNAIVKTHGALDEISRFLQTFGITQPIVIATAAMRQAENANEVSDYVTRLWKVPTQIISGLEEARLSRLGAEAAARTLGFAQGIYFDIGGASTEITLPTNNSAYAVSLNLGAVSAAEMLQLQGEQISNEQLLAAKTQIKNQFLNDPTGSAIVRAPELTSSHALAVGGTLVQAAALCGPAPGSPTSSARKHAVGFTLSARILETFCQDISQKSFVERQRLGIEPGREDILPAGLLILLALLEATQKSEVTVTWWGLRHGLMLEGMTASDSTRAFE